MKTQTQIVTVFIIAIGTLWISGCATLNESAIDKLQEDDFIKTQALYEEIMTIPGPKHSQEARKIAEVAIERSRQLANEYQVWGPALIHNTLVNWGIRERGLCHHFARDLEASLSTIPTKHYEVRHVSSRHSNYFRAHFAVVLGLPETPLEDRIVLDAWRESGELVWAKVEDDKKYPWRYWIWSDEPNPK